jgi:hypothetical protein
VGACHAYLPQGVSLLHVGHRGVWVHLFLSTLQGRLQGGWRVQAGAATTCATSPLRLILLPERGRGVEQAAVAAALTITRAPGIL